MLSRSVFDVQKFNAMLEVYTGDGYPPYQRVSDYDEFVRFYPTTSKAALHALACTLQHQRRLRNCYLVGTSGTTDKPLIVANSFWSNVTPGSPPHDLRRLLGQRVFASTDVVANLLVAGGCGFLYEGMSRALEPIGCSILPVGRLDALDDPEACLALFKKVGVSALLATPAGIVQAAHVAQQASIRLNIRKVVYIGEPFVAAKENYIRSLWPNAQFYGLYGTTEVGLIGISTPEHPAGHYDFLAKWLFVEIDPQNRLFLTDLKAPLVPVIRYDSGDRARLISNGNSKLATLVLLGRNDTSFNFCGNLVSFEQVCETAWRSCGARPILQLTLSTDQNGNDHLRVSGDFHMLNDPDAGCRQIESALQAMPNLAEGIQRGIASIHVERNASLWLTSRQKVPRLRDLRNKT